MTDTQIPDAMKKANGYYFEEAKSADLTHKVPGCENLVENLIAAMVMTGTHDYDDKLKKCAVWSRRAHKDYYEDKDPVKAVDHCNAIMRELTHFWFDDRWVTLAAGAFKYTPEVKK